MKRYSFLVLVLLFTTVFGQKKGKEFTTESGLKITITKKGKGDSPQRGDTVYVHYTGKLEDGTKFDSSHDRGEPLPFVLGKGMVIKGWDEGIALLNTGAEAQLVIPPNLGYGGRKMGTIPANSTLHFDVQLVEFREGIRLKPYEVKGKDTMHFENGLKMIRINSTDGEKAESFKKVKVHYTGYFLDGKVFDSSVERGQPFQFEIGRRQVIEGWDEGIAKLREGEKARLIIPYQLAYGEKGRPPVIPAKSTLVFDVELIDVLP